MINNLWWQKNMFSKTVKYNIQTYLLIFIDENSLSKMQLSIISVLPTFFALEELQFGFYILIQVLLNLIFQ